jgi:putative transcriptional regulator
MALIPHMRTPKSDPPPANLSGSLLLAHPAMRDPNFRRTAVLMSLHSEEGAMGIVLNRPTGRTLGMLNGAFAYSPISSVPVFTGGPVQHEQLILVGWQKREDGFRLHFGVEAEAAIEMAGREDTVLRAFTGFSGWSQGQLENELESQAWVVVPMAPDLTDLEPRQQLWRELLGRISPEWRFLAQEPEELDTN